MSQIEIHKKIDELLLSGSVNKKPEEVTSLISLNDDVKQYFFSRASEHWLEWLWSNHFLDVIKEKTENLTSYNYMTPEISYLVRIAEKSPEKVVQIMLDPDVATYREKFKPELVDQFLRICGVLPPEQIALVVPKIHQQEWVKIMGNFNHWGFEYEKVFKTLLSAHDYKNILLLAETVLAIHTKEDLAKTANGFGTDNPFYFADFDQTGVFDTLLELPGEYSEEALSLVTKVMSKIVLLGGKEEDPDRIFPVEEMFYLFDVDFFNLEPEMSKRLSYRDDVKELAAVLKVFIDRVIGAQCGREEVVNDLYEKYVGPLPESRAMWRLRLYTLSLCPEAFRDKLKTVFFRLFESKYYTDITSGTEYEKTLQKGFGVLEDSDKREYIEKVIAYFSNHEKGTEEEKWHIMAGSDIFSVLERDLSGLDGVHEKIREAGFTINPAYEPQPTVSHIESGFVRAQGPISKEEFGRLPVAEIAQKLREEWCPKKLRDTHKGTDSPLSPHNAEGAGDLLKDDIPNRLQEYVNNADKFFERGMVDQHYTYSFLRGVEDAIKNNHALGEKINWDGLIKLLLLIKEAAKSAPFEEEKRDRDSFDSWLAGWTAVHSGMTDVIQELLREEKGVTIIDFKKYRDQIFSAIDYLLGYPDPTPEREDPKSPMMSTTTGRNEQLVSDPFAIAINTTRGRAFQALVLFIYPDGKELPEGKKIKQDVKDLYERVLSKEDTRALMFMFGHYLPQFYFREIKWIQKLLPQIFPVDPAKSHLFLAAWEGYLSTNLYKELFTDPNIEPLYYRGLSISNIKETTRQYFKDPDEGIAIHIALAFMHYPEFGFDNPLFKRFWGEGSLKQHKEFISFLGRSFVSGDNAQINEFLGKEPRSKELLKSFWVWVLENRDEPELFEEFGFWVNLEKGIFAVKWLAEQTKKTLKKTKGKLDWDYGLTKSAIQLSQEAPADTLEIAKLVFLDGGVRVGHSRRQFYVEREWFDVFRNLYSNEETRAGTYQLIDDLVREGGSPFWDLKAIVEEK